MYLTCAKILATNQMTLSKINTVELVLIVLSIGTLMLYLLEVPHSHYFFGSTMGITSLLYFYLGLFVLTGKSLKSFIHSDSLGLIALLSALIGGAGIGLITAGITLHILNWVSSEMLLNVGIYLLLLSSIGTYFGFDGEKHTRTLIWIRLVITLIAGIFGLLFLF